MSRCMAVILSLLFGAPVSAAQNVVVVLDNSGSMENEMSHKGRKTSRMEAAKTALLTVLDKLPGDAQLGVIVFGSPQSRWIVPLGPVDKSKVREKVTQIKAKGRTPLGSYMKFATDALLKLRQQQKYGTYKLLIVTDGEATDPQYVERYLPDILSRGVWVDVIGVAMKKNHTLETKVHKYRSANNPESLAKAIEEVVLGETTGDSGVAGASDFEMLAAVPSGLASAALQALTETGNDPIGKGVSRQTVAGNAPRPPKNGATKPTVPGQIDDHSTKKNNGFLGVALLTVFLAAMFIVARFVKAKKNR